MEFKKMMRVLGDQTLSSLESVITFQDLLFNVIERQATHQGHEMELLSKLWDAADTIPRRHIRIARAKCMRFLGKLQAELQADDDDPPPADDHGEVSNDVRNQNDRMAMQRNQHYRIKAKRNACKTSRKTDSQKKKSESNVKKNSRYPKSANPGKTSKSRRQPTNFPKQPGLKRKAEELNDTSGSKSDVGSSASINNVPAEPSKVMKSELKSVVIKLKDFMKDPSADNDKYIVQYKQANCDKINEEEFQVVDDMDDDLDEDQRVDSNDNSVNDGDVQEDVLITIESSDEQVEQEEHRTPSLSPRATRSPCAPPGLEPTSDSEVEIISSTF